MKTKIIQLLTFSLLSFLISQKVASAKQETTVWVDTKTSMSALLNDGWKIVSFNRHADISEGRIFPLPGGTVSQINFNTGTADSFLLMKNNIFTICWISGVVGKIQDVVPSEARSTCVKLN